MTGEQRAAFAPVRALAAPPRLRVNTDVEGWPIIPGRLGQIEPLDCETLAVYTDRPRLFAKLWAVPGVRRHQTGDREMRALFPPAALPAVARVIKARTRRAPLDPEKARRMGSRTAYRGTSAAQDARGTVTKARSGVCAMSLTVEPQDAIAVGPDGG